MKKKYTQWFWFIGGFTLGFTLIAVGHAALPKKTVVAPSVRRSSSLSELHASKVQAPEMETGFSKLTSLESRFAESETQQKKLKSATARSARRSARN